MERTNIHNKWLEWQAARTHKLRAVDPPEAPKVVEQVFSSRWEQDWIETEQATLGREVTVYPPHEYTVLEEGNHLRGKRK